jgi:pimeloyl-ACP methyl ester carboxylesterase
VIVPDLPGHGESAPGAGVLRMSQVVAGAEELLDEVARERRAVVVGNSMGAWIATLLAHRHPERVERIVLVNGGAVPSAPGGPSLLPVDREAARRLMALLRAPASPSIPDWMLDDLVARAPASATARLLGDLPDLVAQMLIGRLGEVRTPVDLLWGAADGLMTIAYAEQMAAALPAARLTRIEGCGHLPQLECPARFRTVLAERLAAPPPAAAAEAGAP